MVFDRSAKNTIYHCFEDIGFFAQKCICTKHCFSDDKMKMEVTIWNENDKLTYKLYIMLCIIIYLYIRYKINYNLFCYFCPTTESW